MVLPGVAALFDGFVPKQVAVTRLATNQLAGSRYLETLCDGFAGLDHWKFGKTEERTGNSLICKGIKLKGRKTGENYRMREIF